MAVLSEQILVDGMHCVSCERVIERSLSALEGAVKVSASYKSGAVAIDYDSDKLDRETIAATLADLDYPIATAKPKQKRRRDLAMTFAIIAAVVALYILIDSTGVINNFPMADENLPLPMLFVIGLLTSVHCIAMCGGINISQCARGNGGGADTISAKLAPSIAYNVGRVLSYTIIGGIVGAIGGILTPSGSFRGVVAVVAGVFMVIMGLNMLSILPSLRKIVPHLPKSLGAKLEDKSRTKTPFVVGLANGLMPCGPLQSMQLFALSTASAIGGAVSMLLFSLGTVPLMFGLGALSGVLTAKFTSVMLRVSAVLVILLGVIMLNNGLALSGVSLF